MLYNAEPPLRDVGDEDQDEQSGTANNPTDPAYEKEHKQYLWQVEHLIFPALKYQFAAPKSLASSSGTNSGHVVQLANLPDLYKIFERC